MNTPEHCFTYGSLMCEDIMTQVCGARFTCEAAVLSGHRRSPIAGETYPGMRPASDKEVAGVLYRDLTPAALQRLDVFEGADYTRERVEVRLADGGTVTAWTYIYRPELSHRLGAGEWRLEDFLATGKARFEALYLGFDALHDAGSASGTPTEP